MLYSNTLFVASLSAAVLAQVSTITTTTIETSSVASDGQIHETTEAVENTSHSTTFHDTTTDYDDDNDDHDHDHETNFDETATETTYNKTQPHFETSENNGAALGVHTVGGFSSLFAIGLGLLI